MPRHPRRYGIQPALETDHGNASKESATRKGQNGNSVEDLRRPAPEPSSQGDVHSSE